MDAKGAKTEAKKLALLDFVIFPTSSNHFSSGKRHSHKRPVVIRAAGKKPEYGSESRNYFAERQSEGRLGRQQVEAGYDKIQCR